MTDIPGAADGAMDGSAPPPGRAIVERLQSGLRAAGLDLGHDPTPWEDYGWEFTLPSGQALIWCMLQRSDEWLLITRPIRSFWDRLKGRDVDREHEAIRTALDQVLRADSAVRNLRWYTRAEFEKSGGAPTR